MSARVFRFTALACTCLSLTACGGGSFKEGKKVEVTPVKGVVVVDGKPQNFVKIAVVPLFEFPDKEMQARLSTLTNANGEFKLGTYRSDDGLPPGEYALTAVWQDFKMMTNSFEGGDKLKGKYDAEDKSPKKFTVVKGTPLDLGKIELTTE